MADKNKKSDSKPQQKWTPHWIASTAYKVWRFLFAAFKIVAGAAATVLLIGVICGFVFLGSLGDFLQDDILPMADIDMEDYNHEQNSILYYVDSTDQIQEYQKVYAEISSQWVDYERLPKHLPNAAIAIEDHRYNEHQGVDWITTVKATARMFFGDSSVGGSSITQQLIKNILLSEDESADDITVQRKVLEIFRAIQLEKRYDKQTIMEMYLNVIYLGQNCRGVRSAAAVYFGKEVEMLTLAECASLISITNNPSLFDPYSDNVFEYAGEQMDGMQRNRHRQLLVLGEMLSYGMITQEEYDEAVAQEIVLKNGIDELDKIIQCPNEDCQYRDLTRNFTAEGEKYYCPKCQTLTHVGGTVSQEVYSWLTDTVLEDVAMDLAEKNGMAWNQSTKELLMKQIQSGGYHIYTTLDMDVQKQADKIYTNLDEIPKPRSGQQFQSAIVIIDNRTGDIVAIVGGVGAKEGFDDWNRATDSERQSGSSIKPIAVYAPAFELGAITPATVIKDLPNHYDFGGPYPLNDNRQYSYSRTIFSGIVSSVNAVSANTLEQIGYNYSYEFAKEKFGLSSLVEYYVDPDGLEHTDKDMGPLALGAQTFGVTVRDMASAFATLANNGVYREARTYTKVYDSEGNVVLDNTQDTKELLSQKTVDYTNYCLTNATLSGTGHEANLSGMATAGKTGTTGDNKDRWYCGYTNYYTAAVWTGFDTPEPIYGISGNPASQLFKKVMQPLHEGKKNVALYDESKMVSVTVCLDSGKLATDACTHDIRASKMDNFTPRTATALVYPEDVPTEKCDKHLEVAYCVDGNGVANEYCQHLAQAGADIDLTTQSLVKLTQSEVDTISRASAHNLYSQFTKDYYVYLINSDGSDGDFKGFTGGINKGVSAPYKICTTHTKADWDAYRDTLPDDWEPTEQSAVPEETTEVTETTTQETEEMPVVE